MIRAALITISTSRAVDLADRDRYLPGEGQPPGADNRGGERLVALAGRLEAKVIGQDLIPDDHDLIAARLTHWSGEGGADLVLTSGGTGFAPSDLTPEATSSVIERPAPGIAEGLRTEAARHTSNWALSRGVAGIRGRCLIINLAGNPRAVDEAAPVLEPIVTHAVNLLKDLPCGH